MAINKEFEELLKVALTDGIITPAERQVLLKKAVNLGMDADEADMYISAEIQKLEMQSESIKKQEMGRVCPSCGTPIQQLASKCSACGEPVTAEASKELTEVLDELEDALVMLKSGVEVKTAKAEVERFIRKAKLYHENNPKINMLIDEVKQEMVRFEEKAKKEALIKYTLKNVWFWVAAIGLVGILLMIICGPTADGEVGLLMVIVAAIVAMIKGGIQLSKLGKKK